MSGVTWRALSADAPEPPPLSVVRDQNGDWWLGTTRRIAACGGWRRLTGAGVRPWSELSRHVDLQLAEREDAPWGSPAEHVLEAAEPTDYEVRARALTAAVRLWNGATVSSRTEMALSTARAFAAYLQAEDA